MKINHPASGDVIRNPAHAAGGGTAFEGTISLRTRDDNGTVIAESSTQRLGAVEESASGFSEDLQLFNVPNVFG